MVRSENKSATYNTPMLIANRTPAFSVRSIGRFHRIFHGRIARVKSIVAENAETGFRQRTHDMSFGDEGGAP